MGELTTGSVKSVKVEEEKKTEEIEFKNPYDRLPPYDLNLELFKKKITKEEWIEKTIAYYQAPIKKFKGVSTGMANSKQQA